MLIVQTTRYKLPMTTEAERKEAHHFADGIEAFYGYGGAQVRIKEKDNMLIVEYDHVLNTADTIFGGGYV